MGAAFVKVDLHGLRQDEAQKVIDKAITAADSTTYQIQLIHGYNRGTSLRTMNRWQGSLVHLVEGHLQMIRRRWLLLTEWQQVCTSRVLT